MKTQNTITTLKEQCDKDIDALEETIKDEAYSISKFGIEAPEALPRDQDENGEALSGVVCAMEKSVRGKLTAASAQLKTTEEAYLDAQRGVSEISATLHSTQKAQNAARTKLQALSKTADEFRATGEQLKDHEALNNVPFDCDIEDPTALVRHLDKQIESVDALLVADAPKLAKKIAKKLARELQSKSVVSSGKVSCPCCKQSILEDDFDKFLEELYDMAKNTVPQQGTDIAKQKQAKSTYQSFRKTIESQKDSLRDLSRLRQEVSSYEKEAKRLQDELSRLNNEHKKRLQEKTDAQTNEQDLRALLESIRRWNSEADRISSNKQQIIQKKQSLAASGHDGDRDLHTVEKEIAKLREEKDNYAAEVIRLQKEVSELTTHKDRLIMRVSAIKCNGTSLISPTLHRALKLKKKQTTRRRSLRVSG